MTNPEQKRLETVRTFNQLNFDKNKELDDLVMLASEICQVPIAMIALMDADIQWIKVIRGADVETNTREASFCKYLINSDQVMVVPDTLIDPRFANNPIVTGDAAIRFYAGAPLIAANGNHLGTLCVFDQQPHEFSDKQKELLTILSKQVMNIMELELSLVTIREQKDKADYSERKLRAFFNSSSSCHILIGKEMEVLDFNNAAEAFLKKAYRKQIKTGCSIMEYVSPGYKDEFLCNFKKALAGKRVNRDVLVNYGLNETIWWDVSFQPIKDENDDIISIGYNATDINESKNKTNAIIAQNESLMNIAFVQSHEYRKPVASILGLMSIIRAYDYEPQKECLQLMEKAVNDLDEKIKSVVDHSQNGFSKYSA